MAAFSDYLENELLDHVLANGAFTAPTSIWIALYTAAPSDSGGGTEVTGGAYARVEIAGATGRAFSVAAAGTTDNDQDWDWVTATANWGTVSHTSVMDAVTAGNFLFHGALAASKVVDNGDTFKFLIGDFDITLD